MEMYGGDSYEEEHQSKQNNLMFCMKYVMYQGVFGSSEEIFYNIIFRGGRRQ